MRIAAMASTITHPIVWVLGWTIRPYLLLVAEAFAVKALWLRRHEVPQRVPRSGPSATEPVTRGTDLASSKDLRGVCVGSRERVLASSSQDESFSLLDY